MEGKCTILLLTFGLFIHVKAFDPPKIFLTEDEHIIDSGDNFTIYCAGNKQLEWDYPEKEKNISNIFITTDTHLDYKYSSSITIINATDVNVGFYYCKYLKAQHDDKKRCSAVYLYVKDEKILYVNQESGNLNVVYSTISVVPCRPTSPDVTVKLYKSEDDSEIETKFDPRYGFEYFVEDFSDDEFVCTFTKNHTTQNASYYLNIIWLPTSIAKPVISDHNDGHTILGENLVLDCKFKYELSHFTMDWIWPNKHRLYVNTTTRHTNDSYYIQTLTLENVSQEDNGIYTCVVTDGTNNNNATINISFYEPGENFIHLSEENALYKIEIDAGEPYVQWRIDVDAHPIDSLILYWRDNQNNEIMSNDGKTNKYEIYSTKKQSILKIKDINIKDFGNYTLVASNDFTKEELPLFLEVREKPTLHMYINNYHFLNEKTKVICIAGGFPEPTIFWKFKPCLKSECESVELEGSVMREGLQVKSKVILIANTSGVIECAANNSLGADFQKQHFYVTDIRNGYNLWTSENGVKDKSKGVELIAVGDTLELYCAISIYNYTDEILWFKGAEEVLTNDRIDISRSMTDYSYKSTLIMRSVSKADSDEYICKVKSKPENEKLMSLVIEVSDPTAPKIFYSNLNETLEMDFPDPLVLQCSISGIPKPKLIWLKDNVEVQTDNRTEISPTGEILTLHKTLLTDEGTYTCQASSRYGIDSRNLNLYFKNKPSNMMMYGAIGFLTVILLICVVFLAHNIHKERKLKEELRKTGLANFEKGAVESLNPDLGIDDQAELLPYDKKWEFPREKIEFGKQLGSGAFGVVIKAEAKGIVEGEDSTTVAVKMVKRNADHAYIRALASELKIMVHLGKHINVVNLLGACTKNVAKRELLVIVEFCRYGNLQNYLFRHRDNFIDQIDPNTGHIDYNIGTDILDRSVSFSSNRSNSNSSKNPALKYIAIKFSANSDQGGHINKLMADYRGPNYTGQSTVTETTEVTMSPNGVTTDEQTLTSTGSNQPEWRSNYKGDYKDNVQPISTKDLLTWAFQVARGMEYLSSRKVLHGDLAARNILLADNNIVKICDFGLAKSMYKSGNYKKKSDGPLPIKWMAVESIRDRIFSTQSDIWSFGIVLWEFFSLAKTPYPGMEADERLYQKLVVGYRMDSPTFATKQIYKMMLRCWDGKPTQRPSFSDLADLIGNMLDDSVRQHYIDLNDPYLTMNTNRLESGQDDYLAMFTPPDFANLSSPQSYVNELPPHIDSNKSGYLCMKPGQIFSPRENSEDVFTFDTTNIKTGESECVELEPMLSCDSPQQISSFSNPSYHLLPKQITQNQDIVQSPDNYIHMPKNKSAILNPSEKQKIDDDNRVYINSQTRDWERLKA